MQRMKQRYQVNLPEHLAKCETNYWQLRRLIPHIIDIDAYEHWQLIVGNHGANESIVHFEVLEQSKYTTLLHIVQSCPLQNKVAYVKPNKDDTSGGGNCRTEAKISLMPRAIDGFVEDYSVDVRLYHDAEIAEVVRYQQHRKFSPRYAYPNAKMHQIDEKSKINQFLGELLAHCLLNARVASVVIDGKNE